MNQVLTSLKVMVDKPPALNDGALIVKGGIYTGRGILSDDKITTKSLTVTESAKIVKNITIDGSLYLAGDIRSEPGASVHVGTSANPVAEVETQQIDARRAVLGRNSQGGPGLFVEPNKLIINDNLELANPETNTVMLRSNNGVLEAYTPIYQQWNAPQIMYMHYKPGEVLSITTSKIMLDITGYAELSLNYNASMVPDGCLVKIWFMNLNCLMKVHYKLTVEWLGSQFIFTTSIPMLKAKLLFLNGSVYLM